MSAVVVSHEELLTRLAEPRQPCRFCGKACKTRNGGLSQHEKLCLANPDAVIRPAKIHLLGQVCCRQCRLELASPRRLREHLITVHLAPPPPAPPPVALSPDAAAHYAPSPAFAAPSCRCGRPFARDLADPDGRCLYCSGAYARDVGRRPTSHHAAAD